MTEEEAKLEIARIEQEIRDSDNEMVARLRGEWTAGMKRELLKEMPSILRFAELGDLEPLRRAAAALKDGKI